MYKSMLKSQWENLTAELNTKLKKGLGNLDVKILNEWYKAKVFKYHSINSVESIQLEQTGNKEFAEALLKVIDSFSFTEANDISKKIPPVWLGIPLGIAAGAAVFLSVNSLMHIVWTIILSLVVCVIFTAFYTYTVKKKINRIKQENKIEHYTNQFSEYLEELLAVCDKYGIK